MEQQHETFCTQALPSEAGAAAARVKPGSRLRFAAAPGSADSVFAREAALAARAQGRTAVVICASPQDVRRVAEEVAWLAPQLAVRTFPDWETLPYDILSPHQDLVSERLETLWELASHTRRCPVDVLVTAAATAIQRIAPPEFLLGRVFSFAQGDTISPEKLRADLVAAGYEHVSQVVAPGEFSSRGSILDIFPMGAKTPFRLDLFDDEIDAIRLFDADTQRSGERVPSIRLLPGHEFPMDAAAGQEFRGRWRTRFASDPSRQPVYRDIANGIAAPGTEYFLPMFFEKTASLLDYLPEGSLLIATGDVPAALAQFHTETSQRWKFLSADPDRCVLEPHELYLSDEDFFVASRRFAMARLEAGGEGSAFVPVPSVPVDRKKQDPLEALRAAARTIAGRGGRLLVCASSAGRRETIAQLFEDARFGCADSADFEAFLAGDAPVALTVAPLSTGFALASPDITVLTETELYAMSPARARRRREKATDAGAIVRDLTELKVGDPVVHLVHGVGRYQGLVTKDLGEGPIEFLQISYAGEAKLYVPVTQLHVISRYTGADPETAPLHQLGKGDWEKARRKAEQSVRDTAAELLNLYALRESREGHAFAWSNADAEAFAEGFGFEETPDQAAAIDAVLTDMRSGKPMDRLVCGDVGFGKTEVALRAAFAAVMDGKQVAVLCPTTLLAEQHAQTFKDRFSGWPVRIAELSRFRSSRETAAALEGLAVGTVDIAIGTHKLLGEGIRFARLGLVVIDEEHRFGVRQKERLRSLRAEVDVLTLTATPIPRTLSMSLEGIRDFSVIATAPEKRLAIKTFVERESDGLIREAILRELKRGGQVYFLHNEVETIEARRLMLERVVPEAHIAVAHGQMGERELERVMRDFCRQKFNVLLCTTIIETGIDVPTANTIIMHRADKFGLAQLHQLRGRVGRSHHQAYAYLLTPEDGGMTKQAKKRLEAICSLEDLGSGFYLSMHDLEIRGAGEVLGESQSGDMQEVGFDLYSRMLARAVASLKAGNPAADLVSPLEAVADINLHAPAVLPADYVPDVGQRLETYKQLAAAASTDALREIRESLADRYGRLPDAARLLFSVHGIRLAAEQIGIRRIDSAPACTAILFAEKPNIEPVKLLRLLQESRGAMRMSGPSTLKITKPLANASDRVAYINSILESLS